MAADPGYNGQLPRNNLSFHGVPGFLPAVLHLYACRRYG
nr:MAG TPA: hypothetical protein [Caudoviricetes sp.]